MKIPNGAIVRVEGWVMLQRLPEGRYRVEREVRPEPAPQMGIYAIYRFYLPRGKKCLARHWADPVDRMVQAADSSDLNKIVIESGN